MKRTLEAEGGYFTSGKNAGPEDRYELRSRTPDPVSKTYGKVRGILRKEIGNKGERDQPVQKQKPKKARIDGI